MRQRRVAHLRRSTLARELCIALSLLLLLVTGPVGAENWPAWRGPRGDGTSADRSLPLNWNGKLNVRWHVPLPDRGNSTPIVWEDRVFVTQAIEKEHRRTVMCFARADGRLLWQSGVTYPEREPSNAQNPYCSSSPVTDGRRVYAYFGSPGLFCYDLNGREIWRRELGKVDSWQGSGSSPIVYGRLCILNAGPGTNAMLAACDKETGRIEWQVKPPDAPGDAGGAGGHDVVQRKTDAAPEQEDVSHGGSRGFDDAMMHADPSGAGGFLGSWSTPIAVRAGGRDELIVLHPYQAAAYDAEGGQKIWWCNGLPAQAFASPVTGDGILVAASHKVVGGGTRVTAIRLGGAGDVTATRCIWQTDLRKECVGSGAIAGGRVYLATQFGSAVCLDLATGRKLWEKRLPGKGAMAGSWSSIVLTADNKLLIPNHSGEVFVLAAGPKFELLARNWAGEETTCASPAVSDGQLFLHTYQALWCFGVRD